MAGMYHIKNTAKCGSIEFVSLGLTLPHLQTTENSYKLEALENNPEVMNFKNRNFVQLVPDEAYDQQKKDEAAAAQASAAGEEMSADADDAVIQAIQEDHPNKDNILKCVASIERLLGVLKSQLDGKPVPPPAAVPTDKPAEPKKSDSFEDGLDLPMSAPYGLTPQKTTSDYLTKDIKAKREFLTSCRSSSILRDIALFETDPVLKRRARKRVKQEEESATLATATVPTA